MSDDWFKIFGLVFDWLGDNVLDFVVPSADRSSAAVLLTGALLDGDWLFDTVVVGVWLGSVVAEDRLLSVGPPGDRLADATVVGG